MRSGQRSHYITIQQSTSAPDGYGGQVKTWVDYLSVWAAIRPLNGKELIAASATQNETTHTITFPYITGVTAAHRITYNGRYFNILNVINVEERNRELQCLCSEGLANA